MIFKYRPEIDGLRAIAVFSVILFHAGINLFKGGFVGVDVFFVISGYLITSIILTNLDNKDFSTMYFYERRARRILPTLIITIFFSLIISFFLFSSKDLIFFSKSAAKVSLSFTPHLLPSGLIFNFIMKQIISQKQVSLNLFYIPGVYL